MIIVKKSLVDKVCPSRFYCFVYNFDREYSVMLIVTLSHFKLSTSFAVVIPLECSHSLSYIFMSNGVCLFLPYRTRFLF